MGEDALVHQVYHLFSWFASFRQFQCGWQLLVPRNLYANMINTWVLAIITATTNHPCATNLPAAASIAKRPFWSSLFWMSKNSSGSEGFKPVVTQKVEVSELDDVYNPSKSFSFSSLFTYPTDQSPSLRECNPNAASRVGRRALLRVVPIPSRRDTFRHHQWQW